MNLSDFRAALAKVLGLIGTKYGDLEIVDSQVVLSQDGVRLDLLMLDPSAIPKGSADPPQSAYVAGERKFASLDGFVAWAFSEDFPADGMILRRKG